MDVNKPNASMCVLCEASDLAVKTQMKRRLPVFVEGCTILAGPEPCIGFWLVFPVEIVLFFPRHSLSQAQP